VLAPAVTPSLPAVSPAPTPSLDAPEPSPRPEQSPAAAPDAVGRCRTSFNLDCLAIAAWAKDRGQISEHGEILTRGCTQRFKAACAAAGEAAMTSGRVDAAVSSWTQACELDDAESCVRVSSIYSTKGRKKEGLKYAIKGCLDLHDGPSCGWAAGFLDEDPSTGLNYTIKGCDLDDAVACDWARRYSAGQGQPERADTFARKACRLGERSACP
jgi:hypothetical protein